MINKNTLTYLLILTGIMFSQCGSSFKTIQEDKIDGIKILFVVPMPLDLNNIQQVSDSIFVFFYKNYTAYKIPYLHTYNIIQEDKSGHILSQRAVPEIRYKYFCYTNGNSIGIRYDSASAITGTVVSVDSFINKYGVGTFALPENYLGSYQLVSSKTGTDQLVQFYAAKNIIDPQSYDSVYLYFSKKFNMIPFSLAVGTDICDHKKLNRIRYLFNSRYDIDRSMMIPKREIALEMQKTNASQEHNEIRNIFKKTRAIMD